MALTTPVRRARERDVSAFTELREVVTLIYLQEHSRREVAAFLGVPASTAREPGE